MYKSKKTGKTGTGKAGKDAILKRTETAATKNLREKIAKKQARIRLDRHHKDYSKMNEIISREPYYEVDSNTGWGSRYIYYDYTGRRRNKEGGKTSSLKDFFFP